MHRIILNVGGNGNTLILIIQALEIINWFFKKHYVRFCQLVRIVNVSFIGFEQLGIEVEEVLFRNKHSFRQIRL